MLEISINGQSRNVIGKKASRDARREGMVPCNIYGEKKNADGAPEAETFVVPFSELRKVVYTPNVYVVNINLNGVVRQAILKEMQFHPVSDALLHVDFYEITPEKEITVGIPVKLNGLAQGVRDGGRINLSIRQIKVSGPYTAIPEILNIDVTNLELGKSIKVGELSFEGLKFATAPEVVVCSIQQTRASRAAAAAEK